MSRACSRASVTSAIWVSEENLESPPNLGGADNELISDCLQEISDYACV